MKNARDDAHLPARLRRRAVGLAGGVQQDSHVSKCPVGTKNANRETKIMTLEIVGRFPGIVEAARAPSPWLSPGVRGGRR
jgi:hypothetical protein